MRASNSSAESFGPLSPSQQLSAKQSTIQDLALRSLPGTFMYLVGWFFLYIVILNRVDDPTTESWLHRITGVVTVGAVLRAWLVFVARRNIEKLRLSEACLAIGVIFNSLTWGIMVSLSSLETPLAEHAQIILLTTAGLSAGGAISFSSSRQFTALFLGGMLLPTVFVEFLLVEQMNLEVLVAVVIYFFGMYMVTINPYREYHAALVSNLKLVELSETDGLTGLKNRRAFDAQLELEIQRAERIGYPLSLLLLDIDHFKKINDRYGHPAGDYCLECVAKCIKAHAARSADSSARYGGEEFAVILPNVSREQANIVAERIRLAVVEYIVNFESSTIPMSVSIGCVATEKPSSAMSPAALIAAADKALYRAKEKGRNRVEFA